MKFFEAPKIVYAHCDIPCGIYDPTPAKIAAKTIQKMVMQIKDLESRGNLSDVSGINNISRRVDNKEKQADICEEELYTLWSDFFKEEHLEKYPNLHDIFWKAIKLCSKNREGVDEKVAEELILAVDEISKIFYEAKGDPDRYKSYKEITDKLF